MSKQICLECGQPILITPKDRHRQMIRNVASAYGYTLEDMLSHKRHPEMVIARHHCYYALLDIGLSQSHIGRLMGRDHTTIAYGADQHKIRMQRLDKQAGEHMEERQAQPRLRR